VQLQRARQGRAHGGHGLRLLGLVALRASHPHPVAVIPGNRRPADQPACAVHDRRNGQRDIHTGAILAQPNRLKIDDVLTMHELLQHA
jgi:hypothetical protein